MNSSSPALRRVVRRGLSLALFIGWSGAAAALSAGCSSSSSSASTDAGAGEGGGLGGYDPTPFGGSRPTNLYVPTSYSASTPTPLLVLLHGYSASGGEEDLYLGLRATAEAKGVLYVHPDGTLDPSGNRFWNATDACCNFYDSQVDDVGYLMSLIAEIKTRYNVDSKRIYFFGHSNGAFMSYRMACDHAETVAAIASLAGAMWLDTSKCKPSEPVAVLEVHGTADTEIFYDGGSTQPGDSGAPDGAVGGGVYPAAPTTVGDWVTLDSCSAMANTALPNLDIESALPGAETKVSQWKAGCKGASEVDLWTIQGGSHIPAFQPSFDPDVVSFLLAHPKP